jgi:hypothetical protein
VSKISTPGIGDPLFSSAKGVKQCKLDWCERRTQTHRETWGLPSLWPTWPSSYNGERLPQVPVPSIEARCACSQCGQLVTWLDQTCCRAWLGMSSPVKIRSCIGCQLSKVFPSRVSRAPREAPGMSPLKDFSPKADRVRCNCSVVPGAAGGYHGAPGHPRGG